MIDVYRALLSRLRGSLNFSNAASNGSFRAARGLNWFLLGWVMRHCHLLYLLWLQAVHVLFIQDIKSMVKKKKLSCLITMRGLPQYARSLWRCNLRAIRAVVIHRVLDIIPIRKVNSALTVGLHSMLNVQLVPRRPPARLDFIKNHCWHLPSWHERCSYGPYIRAATALGTPAPPYPHNSSLPWALQAQSQHPNSIPLWVHISSP